MGSFSEVVLSFNFRPDTPDEVLAALSALAEPLPDGAYWGPAPDLPEQVVEPTDGWWPDWREEGSTDEFAAEPWLHDWSIWLRNSMGVGSVGAAALIWIPTKRWRLTSRFTHKSWAEAIFVFLEWLGPFIETYSGESAKFVGYIEDEQEERPYLLWARDGRLVLENLNEREPGAS